MDDRQRKIRDRAYAIWEREGRPEGREHQHWEQAQQEIDDEGGDERAPLAGETTEAPVPGVGSGSHPAPGETTPGGSSGEGSAGAGGGSTAGKATGSGRKRSAAAGTKKPTAAPKEKPNATKGKSTGATRKKKKPDE